MGGLLGEIRPLYGRNATGRDRIRERYAGATALGQLPAVRVPHVDCLGI